MRQEYDPSDEGDQITTSQTKPPYLPKTGEVKRSFDFLITTPGKLRKGTARHGNALEGFVDYNIKLFRSDDRQWTLYLEWVDLQGEGHRVVFPNEVVQAILQRANSIIAQCRSERAQHGASTRREKGFIPFQKKGE